MFWSTNLKILKSTRTLPVHGSWAPSGFATLKSSALASTGIICGRSKEKAASSQRCSSPIRYAASTSGYAPYVVHTGIHKERWEKWWFRVANEGNIMYSLKISGPSGQLLFRRFSFRTVFVRPRCKSDTIQSGNPTFCNLLGSVSYGDPSIHVVQTWSPKASQYSIDLFYKEI